MAFYIVLGLFVFLSLFLKVHTNSTKECHNVTCNLFEMKILVKNCFKCICRQGYFNTGDGLGCRSCSTCQKPNFVFHNCTGRMDTKCGQCDEGYFYSAADAKCKPCSICSLGILVSCGLDKDALCSPKPVESNNTTIPYRVVYVKDCKDAYKSWFYIGMTFIVINVVVIILVIFWCIRKRHRIYYSVDASSLATNSISSLMIKMDPRNSGIILTKEERGRLIRDLPGLYAESLGRLLNPNIERNWVSLAGFLNYTQNQIANFQTGSGNDLGFTQNLLLHWSSKNHATVDALAKALRKIKRDDAYTCFVDFIISLRRTDATDDEVSLAEDLKFMSQSGM